MATKKRKSVSKTVSDGEQVSNKHLKFAQEYTKHYNAAQAARDSGYAPNQVDKLMKNPAVKRLIRRLQTYDAKRYELTKEAIIKELAFSVLRDPVSLFDSEGFVISRMKDIPEEVRRCIEGFKVSKKRDPETGEVTQEIFDVKLTSKIAAIDLAMKHKGLFAAEEHKHTVTLDWTQLMATIAKPTEDPVEALIANPKLLSEKKKVMELPKAAYKVKELIEDQEEFEDD